MVVRMRATRGHTANRRSHHALKAMSLGMCANCKAPVAKHKVCENCGYYKGRKVVDNSAKLKRETKKAQTAPAK